MHAANELELSEAEEAQMRFILPGFVTRYDNITLIPGEDQVLDVELYVPNLPPPPQPPLP